MISNEQAVKACVIAQFLTSKGLEIVIFQYSPRRRVIYIETSADRKIKTLINEEGRYKHID